MTAATPSHGIPIPAATSFERGWDFAYKPLAQDSRAEVERVSIDVEAYYRRYGPMVMRRCRTMLRNEERARDATQDVFVLVLRNRERLSDQHPSSLLYRMATNVCLNKIRSDKRHPEDRDEELLRRIAAADDPERRTGAAALLGRVFKDNKESTRTIAVLHLLDGMTLEEVAAEVSMSVSGVRKRLRGLRAQVKELEGI